MEKLTIASRISLIAVSLYGIFQICELLKPQMGSKVQYYFTFIALVVFSFWSIIDWGIKMVAKKGDNNK